MPKSNDAVRRRNKIIGEMFKRESSLHLSHLKMRVLKKLRIGLKIFQLMRDRLDAEAVKPRPRLDPKDCAVAKRVVMEFVRLARIYYALHVIGIIAILAVPFVLGFWCREMLWGWGVPYSGSRFP